MSTLSPVAGAAFSAPRHDCSHIPRLERSLYSSMQAEPLLTWSEPVTEFVGFVALFLANGAIGFRYAAVRNRLPRLPDSEQRTVYDTSLRRAAMLGLVGTLVQVVLLV